MPYVDFRLYRSPNEIVKAKHILKLSIVRLLRINRTLNRYHTANEILDILKDLQIQYNKQKYDRSLYQIWDDNSILISKLWEKIDNLTNEVNELKNKQMNVQNPRAGASKSISLQTTSQDIVGILSSEHVKLPKIFSNKGLKDFQAKLPEFSDEESKK